MKSLDDDSFIFLLLYVDDMMIDVKSMSEVNKLKISLSSREFDMKDLGEAKKILRIKIHRERALGRLCLSQSEYIMKVLARFNIKNAKPVSTPSTNHFKSSTTQCPKKDDDVQNMSTVPYASVVGCLMYIIVCTRPDLAQVVSAVRTSIESRAFALGCSQVDLYIL